MALCNSSACCRCPSKMVWDRSVVAGSEGRRLLLRSCFFALLSGGLFALQASAGFIAAATYNAGPNPLSVLAGDFNGDGIPDLVVATASNTVNILLGNADGSFQSPQSYDLDTGPLALGDFNGDGHLGIASTSGFILFGNGDGTFQAAQRYGSSGSSIAVADFNGDGKLDLALVTYSASAPQGAVSILLGNGDGTFQSPVNYDAGGSPGNLVVGDFNGDGIPDLAVTNGPEGIDRYSQVSVALGRPDGTFGTFYSYAPGFYAASLAVGDLNGDGRQDLIVANGGISIMLANPDGSFPAPQSIPGGQGSFVAVADFNGDGRLDLAELADWGVTIQLGNGDGTFQKARSYAAAGSLLSLAVGDFQGSGHSDLAVAASRFGVEDGVVSVFLSNPDGSFRAARAFPDGAGSQSVVVGDLNGDGKVDGVTANYVFSFTGRPRLEYTIVESDVEVFLGNGDGTFQASQTYKTGGAPLAVAMGDFNGDGIPDLATANGGVEAYQAPPDSSVGILLGNGDGSFQAAQTFAVGPGPFSLAVDDFNGDGRLDIAAADSTGISVLLGNGDGTFQPAQTYAAQKGSLVSADFNGDGHLDIATSGGSLLLGNGDGTFQSAQTFAGSEATSLAVGDLNGDGIPDLALTYVEPSPSYQGTVAILLGNGDGTFQTGQSYAVGLDSLSVTLSDFNRDGIFDLAVTSAISGTVTVLLGKGDGTFEAGLIYAAGGAPSSVIPGDFNGDGFADLAVVNYMNPGTLSVLLNGADWGGGD